MTIETRLRNTGQQGGGGGGSSNSAGLAGTGYYYLVGSTTVALPFSKVVTAGTNITIITDSTSFFINALTNGSSGSGTVNPGSANYLAYYPVSGTTIDDVSISVSTGVGIAPFNVAILTSTASSVASGDFWFQSSNNLMYLAFRSSLVTYYVSLGS